MGSPGVYENSSSALARARGRGAPVRIWWGALGLVIGGVASCCAVGLPAQFWRLCGSGQVLGGLPAPLVVAAARGNPPGIGSVDRLPREALPPPSEGLEARRWRQSRLRTALRHFRAQPLARHWHRVPTPPTKLLASVACGSLSSERGFPVTAPLSVRTPTVVAYFYGHYNLGT